MGAAHFTPGPWHADKCNAWSVWAEDCKIAKTFDVNQASCYREPTEDERIANARLIAAAPELYEVLRKTDDFYNGRKPYDFHRLDDEQRAYASHDTWQDIAEEIRTALAKARGETA